MREGEAELILKDIYERNKGIKKLIVVDLDGTLLNNSSELDEETVLSITKFINDEIKLTIATGRSYESSLPFVKKLNVTLPVICELGASIVDPVSGFQIESHHLPVDILNEIMLFLREGDFHFNVYLCSGNNYNCFRGSDSPIYLGRKVATDVDDDLKNIFNFIFKDISFYEEFKFEDIRKISIRTDVEEYEKLRESLELRFGQMVNIRRSDINCIDISPRGITKGTGLLKVINMFNLDSKDIMVIGDNETDVSMFEITDNSFAVANADPYTKSKAKHIVPSNEEEGVVYAIREFLYSKSY
ncbi:HAD family hydrolase [Caldisericum sp.]|jgi:Cof subfamily protein (haloacid dehalogenase superfamily)|uniref:HAD family hydrolase n=1 Tax=Caldisericum sp. TaxID=2499687 RepID=UPI003C8B33F5